MTMILAMTNTLSTSVPAAQPAARTGNPATPAKSGGAPSPSFARVLEDRQADQQDHDPTSDEQADKDSIDAAGGDAAGDLAATSLMAQPVDPGRIAPAPDAMATAADQGLTAVLALISGAGSPAPVAGSTGGASAKASSTASMPAAGTRFPTSAATRILAPVGLPQAASEVTLPASIADGADTAAGKSAANGDVAALMANLRASFGKAAPASANPPPPTEAATTANQDAAALVANLRTSFSGKAPASANGAAASNPATSGETAFSATDNVAPPITGTRTSPDALSSVSLVPTIEASAVDAKALPAAAAAVPALPPSPAPPLGTKSLPGASRTSAPEDKSDIPGKHARTDHAPAMIDVAALPDPGDSSANGANSIASAQAPIISTSNDADSAVAAGPTHSEQSVTRHLDLARGNQWLDQLAQDITQAATTNSRLKFQLNPEHLGSLQVEIVNSAAGTSVRMTADNDAARAIIADAQPQLMAEVRAQGLRIAESHVDLGNQAGSGGTAGGQHQSSEDHKPFVRTQGAMRTEATDSARPADDELYA